MDTLPGKLTFFHVGATWMMFLLTCGISSTASLTNRTAECPGAAALPNKTDERAESHLLFFKDPSQRYRPDYHYADSNESYVDFTIRFRLPSILRRLQEDVKVQANAKIAEGSTKTGLNRTDITEMQEILEQVGKLLREIESNGALVNFPCDYCKNKSTCSDLAEWNWALTTSFAKNQRNELDAPRWFDSPAILVECYFYRRLKFIFQNTKTWHDWDYFKLRKAASLKDQDNNIHALLDYLDDTVEKAALHEDRYSESTKAQFRNILRLSVWGNKGDLSFSATHNATDPVNHDFHIELQKLKEILLADQSEEIWDYLVQRNRENAPVRIDIVCGNYGFELTTDLILGEFLLVSHLASQVRYHVKSMPWYVSDVTVPDFHRTLEMVDSHTGEYGTKWKRYLFEGKFSVVTNDFWTMPFQYEWMHLKNRSLYGELSKSDLVIFKGDLNYRKLIGEQRWSGSTPFAVPLQPEFTKITLCSLRGVKSDVVVGLDSDKMQRLSQEDKNWRSSGKYALIQFSKKLDD